METRERIVSDEEEEQLKAKMKQRGSYISKEEQNLQNGVYIHLVKRERIKATELIANFLKKNEVIYTTRSDENPEMWIYKGGIYKPEGRTYIRQFVRKIIGEAFSNQLANDILSKMEVDTFIDQKDFFVEEKPHLICIHNGIYDLNQDKLIEHDPEYRFFNKLNVEFIRGLQCPRIKKFLKGVLSNEKDITAIQEIFGWLLYRDYVPEKGIMFFGAGRNGKGKTIELMKYFLGIENCTNISLEALEKDHFSLGEFFGKLANLSADLSKCALKNTGHFKQLTGHDMISAARKFKNRISFTNYAKMIFAANELPTTFDVTTAFFNRWILFSFPFTFLDKNEFEQRKGEKNIKLADKGIIEKITTKSELNGLFNFALDGLKRLLEKKEFSTTTTTEQTRESWLRKSDSFQAFCLDCVRDNYSSEILKSELRREYAEYCRNHKLKPSGDKAIKRILTETYGAGEKKSGNELFWVGITLKLG